MKPRARKTFDFSEAVHQQLNAYALAASAAGVTLLALSQPSDAKIVYTPVHKIIGKNTSYQLDLNRDGITDFTIKNSHCSYNQSSRTSCQVDSWNLLSVAPAGNNAVEATGGPLRLALDLGRGARIPDHRNFIGRATMLSQCKGFCNASSTGTSRIYGLWRNVANRYLGLKFKIKGKTHYGWARLSVKASKSPYEITAVLTGYAYETIPGKAIVAGVTKGPDDAEPDASISMPVPATLGALAMGAPGLLIWRREESVAATSERN
jgi:hypothetical protein